jgi:uncharacterized Zn finger protein
MYKLSDEFTTWFREINDRSQICVSIEEITEKLKRTSHMCGDYNDFHDRIRNKLCTTIHTSEQYTKMLNTDDSLTTHEIDCYTEESKQIIWHVIYPTP